MAFSSPNIQSRQEVEALLDELLAIRDAEAEKAAIKQQIAAVLRAQENLRRWLELSLTPDAHWHGIVTSEAHDMLALMERERKELAAALLDCVRRPKRSLTVTEEALLDQYDTYIRADLPTPREPDLAEPGTPDKVQLMRDRLDTTQGLWHPDDAKLEPTHRTGYTPIQSAGNFAKVGRDMILLLLTSDPAEKEFA